MINRSHVLSRRFLKYLPFQTHCVVRLFSEAGESKNSGGSRADESAGSMKAFMEDAKIKHNIKVEGSSNIWSKLRNETISAAHSNSQNTNQKVGPRSPNRRINSPKKRPGSAATSVQGKVKPGGYSEKSAGGKNFDGEEEEETESDKAIAQHLKSLAFDPYNIDDIDDDMEEDMEGCDDEKFFEAQAKQGLVFSPDRKYETDDAMDDYLRDVFMEAMRSEDGIYRQFIVDDHALRRVRIPKPRPLKQLVKTTMPRLPGIALNSDSYEIGSTAWKALSRNHYYSDSDKLFMANYAARMVEDAFALDAKLEKETRAGTCDYAEFDMVLDKTFRKGLPGMDEEDLRLSLADDGVAEVSQENTNWDVDAVVNEDDL